MELDGLIVGRFGAPAAPEGISTVTGSMPAENPAYVRTHQLAGAEALVKPRPLTVDAEVECWTLARLSKKVTPRVASVAHNHFPSLMHAVGYSCGRAVGWIGHRRQ